MKQTTNENYLHKEDEMLEGCVQVSFLSQLDNLGEMLMINMGVNSEQTFQDSFGNGQKIPGEWNTL